MEPMIDILLTQKKKDMMRQKLNTFNMDKVIFSNGLKKNSRAVGWNLNQNIQERRNGCRFEE